MLLIFGSPTWVYFDATRNRIGNAGTWAIGTLLLWIVVFPVYLIKRKSLLEEAKSNPVEPSSRQIKLGILAALGVILSIGTIVSALGSGYEIETIEDAMNGKKLKVTKQEVSADSNFVSDVALVCEIKGKNIFLEVTSFFPPGKDEKLNPAPIRSVKAGGQLMIDVPIGKVKLGGLDPIPFDHLVGTIESQEYNNHFSWNISQERLLSTLAGLAKLSVASEHKNSPSELAPEEQSILDKLTSEEAAIKDDEEYIAQLQSQQAQNKTLDDEGSNAMKEELAEKTSQLIERKKALEGLKASAAAIEQKIASLKAADQADATKLSELNKKTEDVITQLVGGGDAQNIGEGIAKLMARGIYIMLAGIRSTSADTGKLIEPAMASRSGAEFIEKLGQEIVIEYKTENGVVQTDFSLSNKNVRKVLNACK